MKVGSMYRYDFSTQYVPSEKRVHIFVYEIWGDFAVGVSLQDSSDIRKIDKCYWQYWTKVK